MLKREMGETKEEGNYIKEKFKIELYNMHKKTNIKMVKI